MMTISQTEMPLSWPTIIIVVVAVVVIIIVATRSERAPKLSCRIALGRYVHQLARLARWVVFAVAESRAQKSI